MTKRDLVVKIAKETDLICVSGDLGAAYMGLQLLEREKAVFEGEEEANPDFTGKEYLLERQLKPEARKDIIEILAKENIHPTSMMDISDGMASHMEHIINSSKKSVVLVKTAIPIAKGATLNEALCCGEDYELLLTVDGCKAEELALRFEDKFGKPLYNLE